VAQGRPWLQQPHREACTSRRARTAAAAVVRVSSSLGTRRARGAMLGDSTGSPSLSFRTRSSDASFRSPLQLLRPALSAHRAHSALPPFRGARSCAASGRLPPRLRRRLRRSSGEGRVKTVGAGEGRRQERGFYIFVQI
jgi:hypothetical protein